MIAPITWSASDHSFPGAGAYVGLASCVQHYTVARWLMPRRAQVYPGGIVLMRPTHAWPLAHFAVRDPSAVRVVPVRAGSPRTKEHVLLQFDFGHRRPEPPRVPQSAPGLAQIETLRLHCDEKLHGVFVLTVGLISSAEADFQARVGFANPRLTYGELCDLVGAYTPPVPDPDRL